MYRPPPQRADHYTYPMIPTPAGELFHDLTSSWLLLVDLVYMYYYETYDVSRHMSPMLVYRTLGDRRLLV